MQIAQALKEMLETGKIKPSIDRTYKLSDTAEAIRYLEAGHARGKGAVITVPESGADASIQDWTPTSF